MGYTSYILCMVDILWVVAFHVHPNSSFFLILPTTNSEASSLCFCLMQYQLRKKNQRTIKSIQLDALAEILHIRRCLITH